MTVKELLENPNQSSPDGVHWEPAIPEPHYLWWRFRLRDALAVLRGKAVAVRQTEKRDLVAAAKSCAAAIRSGE